MAKKDVDLAIVWGPQAGYFAKKSAVPLVADAAGHAKSIRCNRLSHEYNIGMAVRRQDHEFRDSLQTLLDRKHSEILGILKQFGVPVLPSCGGGEPRPTRRRRSH